MVIYNNMAAMSVLNESNRQNNKLSNSMEKLASGLKVRHAGDDALWLCQVRHTLFSEKLRQPTFQWAAFASGYCLD